MSGKRVPDQPTYLEFSQKCFLKIPLLFHLKEFRDSQGTYAPINRKRLELFRFLALDLSKIKTETLVSQSNQQEILLVWQFFSLEKEPL